MTDIDDQTPHHSHGVNTPLDWIRIVFSLGMMIFSITIVLALIINEDTKISQDVHPAAAAIIMWVGIIWMTMVEGGQCSLVGLPPIDRALYKESHPITYNICSVAHKGDNLDRYLMGRQFMVIFINFCISLSGAPVSGAVAPFGMPDMVTKIFLESGIAMVLQNVIVGQLTSQVNASHCMLDYINTHFMTFTLWVALLIEKTGAMHTSYLIQIAAYYAAGKPVESNEPPRDALQNIWFWGRCVLSLALLGYALAVTLVALFNGQTSMADWGLPNGVSLVLFFLLMCLVGLLEGMQIAFFTVAKLPKSERGNATFALRTCDVLFRNGGKNLPGFMCGRQMCVTLCFFIIARVTTLNIEVGVDDNIFGVSDPIQNFFNTGMLGAIITTILGSISWQLVASAFPIAFLSNPLVYIVLQFCLLLEATGICAAAWFLALIQKKIMGFQFDEVYVGTPEERAAKQHADDPEAQEKMVHMGTYAIANDVGTHQVNQDYINLIASNFSAQREKILSNIASLREQVKIAETPAEKEAFETALKMEIATLKKFNTHERNSMRQLKGLQEDDGGESEDMDL